MDTQGAGLLRNVMSAIQLPTRTTDAESIIRELFEIAGITIGGTAVGDIRVHDRRFYERVLREASTGFGEAYMDEWWETDALDVTIDKICRANLKQKITGSWRMRALTVKALLLNLQAKSRAGASVEAHYDIGNDLYTRMLDERLVYTCAYWKNATTLAEAQEAKLDLVCRKIGLRPGMRVLDLGCGWGGFASFAAERYGAKVVGYTVSREQVAWAHEHYKDLAIDIRLDDYRNASGSYDAVVSIGLLEHVGPKNHRAYMELAARCLVPGGVAFIHTIGGASGSTHINPWFDKYIFPNAVVPTLGQLATAMERILVPEDVQNIGPHYDRTLMAWWQNFDAAWPTLRPRYGDHFYRMWRFYLLISAAYFRAREHNLYQIVATP